MKYGTLGVLLFFIVLLLGYENYEIWSSPAGPSSRGEAVKKVEGKAEPPPGTLAPKEPAPRESFNLIAQKNIFSPDRKEFSTAGPASIAKPVTRPQVSLNGVVITEDYQIASIINPGRPLHKGEREAKTLRVGDSVGEYKLTKILPDRIVMEAGEDSFEVLLYDPRAPKRRLEIKTPTAPATITSTAPSGISPGPPPGPPPGTPGMVMPAPAPQGVPVMPRPATPLPVPRLPGRAPEEMQQPPGIIAVPSPAPDPGLWRGRRPIAPAPAPAPGGPPG